MEKVHVDYINYIRSLFNKSPFHCLFDYYVVLFIACQFALESHYGESLKAQNFHNHCGMKFPKSRPSMACSCVNGFSSYVDDQACVDDYVLRTIYYRPDYLDLLDVSRFSSFLVSSHYCSSDSDYISKVSKIMLLYEKNSSFSS